MTNGRTEGCNRTCLSYCRDHLDNCIRGTDVYVGRVVHDAGFVSSMAVAKVCLKHYHVIQTCIFKCFVKSVESPWLDAGEKMM